MYAGRQHKEPTSRVFQQLAGKRTQQFKGKYNHENMAIQGNLIEGIQGKLMKIARNGVLQKKDVRKKAIEEDQRFLCYTLTSNLGRAHKVFDVNVFDNGTVFDGGSPTVDIRGYDLLNHNNWVRFHILNQMLGGPGDKIGNLIPTRKSDNNSPNWSSIEKEMKDLASKKPGLHFDATVNYHQNTDYPASLTGNYGALYDNTRKSINLTFNLPSTEDYPQDPKTVEFANKLSIFSKQKRNQILEEMFSRQITNPPRRRFWTSAEDLCLLIAVEKFGKDNWPAVADHVGHKRTKKACSERWDRSLNPKISKTAWTKEENEKLITLVKQHGDKAWIKIADKMGDRSDLQCRFRYRHLTDYKSAGI